MTKKSPRHLDCRNYAAFDVVKGICHRTKEMVMGDLAGCSFRSPMPACKHCAKFVPDREPFQGICRGGPAPSMTYPDLCAVTCEWFAWKTGASHR